MAIPKSRQSAALLLALTDRLLANPSCPRGGAGDGGRRSQLAAVDCHPFPRGNEGWTGPLRRILPRAICNLPGLVQPAVARPATGGRPAPASRQASSPTRSVCAIGNPAMCS